MSAPARQLHQSQTLIQTLPSHHSVTFPTFGGSNSSMDFARHHYTMLYRLLFLCLSLPFFLFHAIGYDVRTHRNLSSFIIAVIIIHKLKV